MLYWQFLIKFIQCSFNSGIWTHAHLFVYYWLVNSMHVSDALWSHPTESMTFPFIIIDFVLCGFSELCDTHIGKIDFVFFQHCCWPHFLKYISSRTPGSRFLIAPLFHYICSSVHDFPLRPNFTACSVFNKRVHTWQHVLLFPVMHEHPSFRIAPIIS